MAPATSANASAPGKVILFGEHAVVYGEASLSLAINKRARVHAELGGAHHVVNGAPLDAARHAYIAQAFHACWTDGPVQLSTVSEIPRASGVGSSAALSVATVGALERLKGEAPRPALVAQHAFQAEFETQGGASPNDTTVSTAGGAVLLAPRRLETAGLEFLWEVRRGNRVWNAHRARLPKLPLVVAVSGRKSRTSDQVAKVRRFVEKSSFARDVVRDIGRTTIEGVQALADNDLRRVGRLMNRNQEFLHILGVDSPELERLVAAARRLPSTYGAKLTGAGGGGSIIALSERPDELRNALAPQGAQAFIVDADPAGLRWDA